MAATLCPLDRFSLLRVEPGLPVREHRQPGRYCSAGKDWTGIVIALILAVLGVPDDVIAADYALSAIYLDPS